jgi:[ribosomal protein S18]-alanine N-acetyltransferase
VSVATVSAVTVRPAEAADREFAARLMAGTDPWITLGRGYDACLAATTTPTDVLDIAEIAGERCGFVLVRPRGVAGAPYIVSIAVVERYRSHGVGAALLAHVEDAYRDRSAHLFLCVSSFNPRARAFYERHGFEAAGVFKDFVIAGADEVLMHKRLDQAGPAPALG